MSKKRHGEDRTGPEVAMSDRYQTHHDWEGDGTVALSVIEAVAAVSGTEPTEFEPLYNAVDPDALNKLFASFQTRSEGLVSFTLDGYDVTVASSGEIEIQGRE